jgi:MarR family transcriptional regulator, organic hydroperoxide resistance regulator
VERACPDASPDDAFFDGEADSLPLGRLLPRVGSAVDHHYQRLVAEHGLTPTALGVLGVLGRADGLSHRELAGRLRLTPATLTPVVDGLEAAGEVRRARDGADRRVVRLWLTATGRDRVAVAACRVAAGLRARLPPPPAGHEDAIRRYLLAVLDAVRDDGR